MLRGSRTIEAQARSLSERVVELSDLLDQNRALRLKVERAARGAAALNESPRRIAPTSTTAPPS